MIQRLQQKRNEDGFTLIELLIVIIVLGILAAIVVFAIGSTRKDSVAASCKTNLKAIELSAEGINTKTGAYPAGPINANNASALVAPATGALLKTFPTSPDYHLQYTVSGTAPNQLVAVNVFPKASVPHATNGSITGTGVAGVAGCDAL